MTCLSGLPRFVVLLFVSGFVVTHGHGAELFVATNGNDAWSGTVPVPNAERTDGPFATLARARDGFRKRKAEKAPAGPSVVSVRGGMYYLSAV